MTKSARPDLEVFRPGADVELNGMQARVLAVQIEGEKKHVSYKVAWWNGNSRCDSWVDGSELTSRKKLVTAKIGFMRED